MMTTPTQYQVDRLRDRLHDDLADLIRNPSQCLATIREFNHLINSDSEEAPFVVWGVDQFHKVIEKINDPSSDIYHLEEDIKISITNNLKMLIEDC